MLSQYYLFSAVPAPKFATTAFAAASKLKGCTPQKLRIRLCDERTYIRVYLPLASLGVREQGPGT